MRSGRVFYRRNTRQLLGPHRLLHAPDTQGTHVLGLVVRAAPALAATLHIAVFAATTPIGALLAYFLLNLFSSQEGNKWGRDCFSFLWWDIRVCCDCFATRQGGDACWCRRRVSDDREHQDGQENETFPYCGLHVHPSHHVSGSWASKRS